MLYDGEELAKARVLSLLDDAKMFDELTLLELKERNLHKKHDGDFSPRQWEILTSIMDARSDYLVEFAFIVYRTAFRDALEMIK